MLCFSTTCKLAMPRAMQPSRGTEGDKFLTWNHLHSPQTNLFKPSIRPAVLYIARMIWHLRHFTLTARYFKSALAFDTILFDTRLFIDGLNNKSGFLSCYFKRTGKTYWEPPSFARGVQHQPESNTNHLESRLESGISMKNLKSLAKWNPRKSIQTP